MLYSEWTAINSGIFYQLNRVKVLPFTNDNVTVDNLDQEFLLENANKEMFSSDTATIVNSILAAYYNQWQELSDLYKTIEPGITDELISSSSNISENQNKVALNDSDGMFTTGGNNTKSNIQTSTKTKNYLEYQKFVLSNGFYAIINMQVRNYLFINVY